MKYILLLIILCSCLEKREIRKEDYAIVKLFTQDGVTIYRFTDRGNFHYFSSHGEVEYEIRHGKTSHYENLIKVD